MSVELSPEERAACARFRAFTDASVAPHAQEWDHDQAVPPAAIAAVAAAGFLGAAVPAELGGLGLGAVSYGLLHQELGRGCSSLRSILTVHGMVCHAIDRWGTPEQRRRWLPRLASGEVLGAFALSEPEVGSDAKSVQTTATPRPGGFVLNGSKRWITAGGIAHLFLVLARTEEGLTAFLVEGTREGLTRRPVSGLLGLRAALLADLELDSCPVPADALLARPGFGFSHVVGTALHDGRYTVAWGCVGLAEACVEASLTYAGRRHQFGVAINQHQLVQRMLSDMVVGVEAARLLCCAAGRSRERASPRAILETAMAKYFASTTAVRIAHDALQVHGAAGCTAEAPVQRHLRDARLMEIIEGSTQIQQTLIARLAARDLRPAAAGAGAPED